MTNPTNALVTVGRFTYNPATSEVVGPAEYMRSAEYARCVRQIADGTSYVFRSGLEHSPTAEIALLVTIQTDYAGWHGMKTFNERIAV